MRLNWWQINVQNNSTMAAISDAVVIGIVLGLVFGAVCYYLFSRMTQLERKVGLMENILLDLKVTTEQTLLSVTEPPDQEQIHSSYHEIQQQDQSGEEEGGQGRGEGRANKDTRCCDPRDD